MISACSPPEEDRRIHGRMNWGEQELTGVPTSASVRWTGLLLSFEQKLLPA